MGCSDAKKQDRLKSMSKREGKLRVGILFGGRSAEHDVSITSAQCVLRAIDGEKYEVVPIRISRNGRWTVLPSPPRLDCLAELGRLPGAAGVFSPLKEGGRLISPSDSTAAPAAPVDVVFPLLHGVCGEDGSVQGLLTLAGVAYVGAEVAASALGMDKVLMKHVFQQAGLPVAPFWWIARRRWQDEPDAVAREVERRLGYPCFVKPANTGSSIGISKAHDREELTEAFRQAARLDLKILVEKAIDARELECGVLGNDSPQASVVGEVFPGHEFYDYEAKYGDEGTRIQIPAEIDPALAAKVQAQSVAAFQAIDACGLARVDFFLERRSHQLYVNEINTIPGFTPQSMFPRLWEAGGVAYPELIDRLIELALERHEERQRTQGYEENP